MAANDIPALTTSNTFQHWLNSTNSLIAQANLMNSGVYVKEGGDLKVLAGSITLEKTSGVTLAVTADATVGNTLSTKTIINSQDISVGGVNAVFSNGNVLMQVANTIQTRNLIATNNITSGNTVNVGSLVQITGTNVLIGDAATSNVFVTNTAISGMLGGTGATNSQFLLQAASGGYGRFELGGSTGGYIDFKTPYSDDYDHRIQSTASGLDIIGGSATAAANVVNITSANVNIDSGTLFVDSIGDKVGIGTTAPTEKLQVSGNTRISGNLAVNWTLDPGFTVRSLKVSSPSVTSVEGAIYAQTNIASNIASTKTGLYSVGQSVSGYTNNVTITAVLGIGAHALDSVNANTVQVISGYINQTSPTGNVVNGTIFSALNGLNSGTGSIISQYGFNSQDLTIGTNNYGFYSQVSAGANKWGFYSFGSANNYFAGSVGIANTTPVNTLSVTGNAYISSYLTIGTLNVSPAIIAAYGQANSAYGQANSAYGQANSAYTQANNAYGQANSAYSQANNAYGQANSAYGQANNAYTQANNAYGQANSAYTQANNAYGQANSAYGQANSAYTQANSAYTAANNSGNTVRVSANTGSTQNKVGLNFSNTANILVSVAAGTAGNANISFDLPATLGSLSVTSLSATTLTVTNPIVGPTESDSASYRLRVSQTTRGDGTFGVNQGGSNGNAEIRFLSSSNVWQVTANNLSGTYYSVISTQNVSDSIATTSSSNVASLTAVKTAYDQGNNAYTQANNAYTQANNAYSQANSGYTQANNAYSAANSAANTVMVSANTGSTLTKVGLNFNNTSSINVTVASGTSGNANISFSLAGSLDPSSAYSAANAAANTVAVFANGSLILAKGNLNFNNTSSVRVTAAANGTTQTNVSFSVIGGPGSGLDADTLDGLNSTAFIRPDVTISGNVSLGANASAGPIISYGSVTGGSGYLTSGVYLDVPLTGGTGSGATADITVSAGAVSSVAFKREGRGYLVGDVLSASNANLGGSGAGFSVPVATVRNVSVEVNNANPPRLRLDLSDTTLFADQEIGSVLYGINDASTGGSGDPVRLVGVASGSGGGGYLSILTAEDGSDAKNALSVMGNNDIRIYANNGVQYYRVVPSSPILNPTINLPTGSLTLKAGTTANADDITAAANGARVYANNGSFQGNVGLNFNNTASIQVSVVSATLQNANISFTATSGTTSVPGIVQLTDSVTSTSTTTASTPNSVKTAYDLAVSAANGARVSANTGSVQNSVGINFNNTASVTVTVGPGTSGNANVSLDVVSGTISKAGILQLTDSVTSTSTTTAATANSAKSAYDQATNAYGQANSGYTQANSAYGQANSAYTQANNAYTQANSAYSAANSAANTVMVSANTGSTLTKVGLNFSNTAAINVSVAAGTAGNANVTFSLNTSSVVDTSATNQTKAGGLIISTSNSNSSIQQSQILISANLANATTNAVAEIAANPTTGFAAIELGGSVGTYIDFKVPNADDFDYRLVGQASGFSIYAGSATAAANVLNIVSGNVNIDSGTTFVDFVNDRLGVGTTVPTQKLDVRGAVYASGGIDANTIKLNGSSDTAIAAIKSTNTWSGIYTVVDSPAGGSGYAIVAHAANATGVVASTANSSWAGVAGKRVTSSGADVGVYGYLAYGNYGLRAESNVGAAIYAATTGPAGTGAQAVYGTSANNHGIEGRTSNSSYAGVVGWDSTVTNNGQLGVGSYGVYCVGNTYISKSLGVGTAATGTTGEIVAANNITAYYSDERLKTNIRIIPNAVDKVMSLRGVTFDSNEEAQKYGYNDKDMPGVIAQDVDAIFPQIVKPAPFDYDTDLDGVRTSISGNNYKTVQYEKLVPVLIEAIKELKAEIEELKKGR